MVLHRSRDWWNAALERAEITVAESLLSTIPAGVVVTPTMIHTTSWDVLDVFLCWMATGILAGLLSILRAYAKGIPEVSND